MKHDVTRVSSKDTIQCRVKVFITFTTSILFICQTLQCQIELTTPLLHPSQQPVRTQPGAALLQYVCSTVSCDLLQWVVGLQQKQHCIDYPIPSSASFAGVKGENVSSAGWQVALCVIPYGMWCNGVMTSQTAVSVLLAYFTVLAEGRSYSIVLYLNIMCPVAGCQCMVCMYLNQKLQMVKGEESMSASSGLLLYSAYFHSHSTRPN